MDRKGRIKERLINYRSGKTEISGRSNDPLVKASIKDDQRKDWVKTVAWIILPACAIMADNLELIATFKAVEFIKFYLSNK